MSNLHQIDRRKRKTILWSVALAAFVLWPCFSLAATIDDLKRDLENQIRQKQEEINQYQSQIGVNQQKKKTLQNEITILEDQIRKVQLEIKQIDLTIQKSELDIGQLDEQIVGLEREIVEKRDLLAEYIRLVFRHDQETLLEIVLKNDNFSDFFEEFNALETAQERLHAVLASIHTLKLDLQGQKSELEAEKEMQNRLKSMQLAQRQAIAGRQNQKEVLLAQTNGEEKKYQQMIVSADQEITQIKEQLSLLEKYHITLDEAVQSAIFAATKTGIRPAYLLGVLEAESRLGLNVGTGNWQKDMYQCYRRLGYISTAEKQKNAFLQICEELGLNPDTQPVSAEPWYGCGGAMGIGQFMPTTWLAYKDRVAALTGHNPPSPWVHVDAFTAAAIKLSEGGAADKTELGERTAYAKYLAGANYKKWIYNETTVGKVIRLADSFQEQYF